MFFLGVCRLLILLDFFYISFSLLSQVSAVCTSTAQKSSTFSLYLFDVILVVFFRCDSSMYLYESLTWSSVFVVYLFLLFMYASVLRIISRVSCNFLFFVHVLRKTLFPNNLRYFYTSFSNIFVLIQLDKSSISLSAIYRRFNSKLDRCSFVTRIRNSFVYLIKKTIYHSRIQFITRLWKISRYFSSRTNNKRYNITAYWRTY